MTDRVNLVDAYDNRSVVAKLVNMEERISGAESSIEKTVEDGQTSIDTKVSNGATRINSLMTDLKDIKTEATAAASTAETATATANAAVTKAEDASATIAANVTACANAAADSQGYAITGKLHDGTAVNSADYLQKLTQTTADAAKTSASQASGYAESASNSATAASQNAASAEASAKAASTSETNAKASADAAAASAKTVTPEAFVQVEGAQTVTGAKALTNTGNTIKVASRSTAATSEDVINFGDINAVNGEYNMLVHREGDEPVNGTKVLSSAVICMNSQKVNYQSTRLHSFDAPMRPTGSPLYFALIFAGAESVIKIFHLYVLATRDSSTGEWTVTPSVYGSSIGSYIDSSYTDIRVGVRYPRYVQASSTNTVEFYFSHYGSSYNQCDSVTVLAANSHGGDPLVLSHVNEVVSKPVEADTSDYKYTEVLLS